MHNKQTDKKQIPKLTCTINWGYNSYFTILFRRVGGSQIILASVPRETIRQNKSSHNQKWLTIKILEGALDQNLFHLGTYSAFQ